MPLSTTDQLAVFASAFAATCQAAVLDRPAGERAAPVLARPLVIRLDRCHSDLADLIFFTADHPPPCGKDGIVVIGLQPKRPAHAFYVVKKTTGQNRIWYREEQQVAPPTWWMMVPASGGEDDDPR